MKCKKHMKALCTSLIFKSSLKILEANAAMINEVNLNLNSLMAIFTLQTTWQLIWWKKLLQFYLDKIFFLVQEDVREFFLFYDPVLRFVKSTLN